MNKLINLLVCIFLFSIANAQTSDSTTMFRMQTSKSNIISNYRNLLMDNIIERNIPKIKQLLSDLQKYENEYYIALYPAEKWMVYLAINDFQSLTAELSNIDTAAISAVYTKIQPTSDALRFVLQKNSVKNSAEVLNQIQSATYLSDEDKAVLALLVQELCSQNPRNHQEKRNIAATSFLATYPQSKYDVCVRYYFRVQYTDGPTFGIEIYGGTTIMNQELSQTFDNGFFGGLGFIWGYRSFQLNTRFAFGVCKLKNSANSFFGTDKRVPLFLPEISLAYKHRLNKHFSVSPLLGIAWCISQPNLEENLNSAIELSSSVSPIIGLDLGWEFHNEYYYQLKYKRTTHVFNSLNLRYTLQSVSFPNSNTAGILHCLAVSFKMGAGGAKRKY